MDDDYRVTPRQNIEVRKIAKKLRVYYGVDSQELVDVIECAERGSILTVDGEKPLKFEALNDADMGSDNGRTRFDGKTIIVSVRRAIRHSAYMGDGYARNTIGHELGHASMHYETLTAGVAMARRVNGNKTPGWIKFYESAEHQAKVFAPAFFVNDNVAATLPSAEEISVRFGISQQSAEIYFAEMITEQERVRVAAKMRSFADEFGKKISDKPRVLRFINEPCLVCHSQTVIPINHKFMCQTCDAVYDRFQDGDLVD